MTTPQQISKAVIKEMVTNNSKPADAVKRMIELWRDAFPVVQYVDDKDAILARKDHAETKKAPTVSPSDALRADITFDEMWGEDITDNAGYAGVALERSDLEDIDAPIFTLNAHMSPGLTRSQLTRTGFKEHGGIVLTFLNPMLTEAKANIVAGSHVHFQARLYRIAEVTQVVKWEAVKGKLYTAVNCL